MTLKNKNKTSGLIEMSMRESNYCMFFMEANRSKVFEIINRRTFYIFPAVFMFCKVKILLFSSLLNMWVGGSVVDDRCAGESVGKWSVDLIKPENLIFMHR